MATTVGSAYIKLGVASKGFKTGLNQAKNQVQNFSQFLNKNVKGVGQLNGMFENSKSVVNDFAGAVGNLGGSFKGLGAGIATASPYLAVVGVAIGAIIAAVKSAIGLLTKLGKQVISFGKECVGSAKEAEKLQTILNSRLGSQVGGSLMKQIREFSGTYGIKVDPLISATHTLLDFGYSAEEIPSMLYNISTAAAQAGGDINSAMSTITTMIGRIKMTGKVTSRQLLQLQQNGIDVLGNLQRQLGISTQEAYQKISSMSPDEVMRAITNSMNQSRGALENYANTYEGRMNALQTTFENLKITIGTMLLPFLEKAAIFLQAVIKVVSEWVENNKDKIIAFFQELWNKLVLVVSFFGKFADTLMQLSGTTDFVYALNQAFETLLQTIIKIHNMLNRMSNWGKVLNFNPLNGGSWKKSAEGLRNLVTNKGIWNEEEVMAQWRTADKNGGFASEIGGKVAQEMANIENSIKVPAANVQDAFNYSQSGATTVQSSINNDAISYLQQIAENTGTLGDIESDNILQNIPLEGY